MALGGEFSFTVESIPEVVLQQHGTRLGGDLVLELRKAAKDESKRYEATQWVRSMVGAVSLKDIPAEPTEEEFRLGLRNGQILCNIINKIHPGAVPKVVESPCKPALIRDVGALTAFQYFENVTNFLLAVQELGLPKFKASDLEQGGNPSKIVNCILALKSYGEWKGTGGLGTWKFVGNLKPGALKSSIPFTNDLSRNFLDDDISSDSLSSDLESDITIWKELKVEKDGKAQLERRQAILDRHQKDLQELKSCLESSKADMSSMQLQFCAGLCNISMHIHRVANAASSYYMAMEENRKLYNQVRFLWGSIMVCAGVQALWKVQPSKLSRGSHMEEGNIIIKSSGKGNGAFSLSKAFGSFVGHGWKMMLLMIFPCLAIWLMLLLSPSILQSQTAGFGNSIIAEHPT